MQLTSISNNGNANAISQQLIFITDLEKITGRNRLTLRRWWTADKFPKPIKLNGTVLAWHINVIDQWITQNMNIG